MITEERQCVYVYKNSCLFLLMTFHVFIFFCWRVMMGESPNLTDWRTVKTTLMLLQHVGAKLTSSFYTDSVSSSQHLKNVSFRSYDLAHCRNHRKFQVFQLAKHKNNNLWTYCAQLNMRMISWALQLHYLKETNKR